jgi:hypothetical protein
MTEEARVEVVQKFTEVPACGNLEAGKISGQANKRGVGTQGMARVA